MQENFIFFYIKKKYIYKTNYIFLCAACLTDFKVLIIFYTHTYKKKQWVTDKQTYKSILVNVSPFKECERQSTQRNMNPISLFSCLFIIFRVFLFFFFCFMWTLHQFYSPIDLHNWSEHPLKGGRKTIDAKQWKLKIKL